MRQVRSVRNRRFVAVVLLIVVLSSGSAATIAAPAVPTWRLQQPWSTETAVIRIGSEAIQAEIADTSALRGRGLGYRDGLEPGTGMLFVYESPSNHTFWMKGMRFCLDIIWIEQGEIKGAAESVCPLDGVPDSDLPRYPSPEPVTYVLELPAGWLQDHEIGAGEPVTIDLP